ncbi:MAG: DNA-binding response regulator [Acidobacteria bacterium]|nr:MAG: DNA-binding response regulator [Acidobacteriota bacterium]MCL4286589.1 response regulator transcription factor [Thermoleophilia bacterium]GIK77483.1 MAG: DNA-binding response regulator [Actinomycetes bacterium]
MTEPAAESLDVLVVDDHDVVHWGFKLLLAKQGWVGSCVAATSSAEAIECLRRGPVDVALVDLFLGAGSGADLCEEIRRISPDTRVLLMSGAGTISPGAARAAGAAGFVSKSWRAADIAMAVRMVGNGMTVFEPGAEPAEAGLSAREREVLRLIAAGATNREIAERLYLSPHTIKEYTSSLYRKLGVRNRAEAASRAEQLGLG